MTKCKINGQLLPVKGHYFFYFAAVATLMQFLPVIGRQLGLSEVEVGTAYTVAPIMGIIAKPLFGMIGDNLKKRKLVFLLFIFLSLISFLGFAFLTQAQPGRPVSFECGSSPHQNYVKYCNNKNMNTCSEKSLELMLKVNDDFLNTTEMKNSYLLSDSYKPTNEICHISCKVEDDDDMDKICKQLITTENIKLCESQMYSDLNSGSMEFDTKIKYSEYELNNDCLIFPAETIRFGIGKNNLTFQQFSCSSSEKFILKSCFMNCPNNLPLNNYMEQILENVQFESEIFWYFSSLVVLSLISFAVVNSMSDALCFQTLGDKPEDFGKQRQWSEVGWGASALMVGYLVDQSSQGKILKDYTICYYLLVICLVLDLIMSFKWKVIEPEKPESVMKGLCFLFSDLRIAVFFVTIVIIGMCAGTAMNFLFWLIENVADDTCEAGQSVKLLQGVIGCVACFSQIPFFYFSGWFIKKLGTTHCLTLVLFVFGIRMMMHSFITNLWLFVPVEVLQGVTFGLFYPVMASYASEISPPGFDASIQGIVGAGFEGIGFGAGSFVAGILFQLYGGPMAFRIFGVTVMIYCILHAFIMYLLGKPSSLKIPKPKITNNSV